MLHSFVRVLNLTDEPYKLQKDRLFGTASNVKISGPATSSQAVGKGSSPSVPEGMAAHKVTQDDVQQVKCLTDALPAELSADQHMLVLKFICKNAAVFSKGGGNSTSVRPT